MDIKTERKKEFTPIKIELTIETKEELEYFWSLANHPLNSTKEKSHHPHLLKDQGGTQMEFFRELNKYRN